MADMVIPCTSATAIRMEGSSYYNIRPCSVAVGTGRFSSNLVDVRCSQFVACWYHSSTITVVSV